MSYDIRSVMPVKTGIQVGIPGSESTWIPAFAGMTRIKKYPLKVSAEFVLN